MGRAEGGGGIFPCLGLFSVSLFTRPAGFTRGGAATAAPNSQRKENNEHVRGIWTCAATRAGGPDRGDLANQSAPATASRQSKINIYPEKVSGDADKCAEPMTIQWRPY